MSRSVNAARKCVLACLHAVERGHRGSGAVLAEQLVSLPDRRDRAFTQQIVMAVLRYRLQLDWQIDQFLARPDRLDIDVRTILRMGLAQWWYCDRVPAYAIVDESVRLVREITGISRRSVGLVNAVLRKLVRTERDEALSHLNPDDDGDLAVLSSHPPWLIHRWRLRLRTERLTRILYANNEIPPVFFRKSVQSVFKANGSSLTDGFFSGIPTAELRSPGESEKTDYDLDANYRIQDLHSQWTSLQLNIEPSCRVFDVCSGRGGKTLCMIDRWAADEHWSRTVRFTAADIMIDKLHILKKELAIMSDNRQNLGQAPPVDLVVWNFLNDMRGAAGKFDRVLLDAPCSNLGVIRRHPELRWRIKPHDIEEVRIRQRRFLQMAARLVSPGGFLLYAVCSFEEEEGYEVVQSFLESCPDFYCGVLEPPQYKGCDAEQSDEGFITLFPVSHGGDGFFLAKIYRKV